MFSQSRLLVDNKHESSVNSLKNHNDQIIVPALKLFHDAKEIENEILKHEIEKKESSINDLKFANVQHSDRVRLLDVKSKYRAGILSIADVKEKYQQWVSYDQYMVLTNDECKNIAVKCSKRGNDVYRYRTRNTLDSVFKLSSFLNEDMFNPNDTNLKSNCLFVTLTYDTKRCSVKEAWDNIGKDINRYFSNIKRKFGRFANIRVFEAHANGYPHVHILMIFGNHKFSVFEQRAHNDILENSIYRVDDKKAFEQWHGSVKKQSVLEPCPDNDKDVVGFVDVQAVSNIGHAMNYITKYLVKSTYANDEKAIMTNAMMWVHNKRSFAVSASFKQSLKRLRLERQLHNSNKKINQIDLEGIIVDNQAWRFVGIFSKNQLLAVNDVPNEKTWTYHIENIPEIVDKSYGSTRSPESRYFPVLKSGECLND